MPDPLSGTFRGELWTQAREMIASNPAGQTGLTAEQVTTLTTAASRGGVSAAESRLLQVVANPVNVEVLEDAIEGGQYFEGDRETVVGNIGGMLFTDFDPTSVRLVTPEGEAMAQRVDRANAGRQVGAGYPGRAGVEQAQADARATRVEPGGPLDITSDVGRQAILDHYSQVAGGQSGPAACGAAVLVGSAVHAGPASLAALATATAAWGDDVRLSALAERLTTGDRSFTLEDLAILQDAVFRMVASVQTELEHPSADNGLTVGAIQAFLTQNPAVAESFGESSILGIDNDGDGEFNHYVVLMRFDDGRPGVFDPWPQQSGSELPGRSTGSHLAISGSDAEATARFTSYVRSREFRVTLPGGRVP